jgi:hypothetical protein
LYQTTTPDLINTSKPLDISDTPGPGTYINLEHKSISNTREIKKESTSSFGFGIGFASKTNRFQQSALSNAAIKNPSPMVELVYARACSTPGPGLYASDVEGAEFG